LSEKDPAARESLQLVVQSAVLTPVEGEYEATLAISYYAAALAGGRVGDKVGCGGLSETIPLTWGLAVSSEISPIRGISLPERLVIVGEPRLVNEAPALFS
jgi:hypothetical protein